MLSFKRKRDVKSYIFKEHTTCFKMT